MTTKTFSVRVAKREAMRLLAEAMRRKQAEFPKEKAEYQAKLKEVTNKEKEALAKWKQRVTASKTIAEARSSYFPSELAKPAQPTLSLCDEKQLLTMLKADTREVIPVPEGSLLWTLIQGKCTPIK